MTSESGPHPEELLGRYPDLVDDGERREVEEHLAVCARCRRLLAHLERIERAGGDLGRPPLAAVPSADLVARARARIREVSPEPATDGTGRLRRLGAVAVPLTVAAAVLLAILLRPDDDTRPGGAGGDPGYGVKGDDDSAEDLSDVELQLVLPVDGEARLLFPGDRVPASAELLLGVVLPEGVPGAVVLASADERRVIWTGLGDDTTANGGALFTDGQPVTAQVPDVGDFTLELRLGTDPAAEDARLLHEFPLVVDPGEER